MKKKYVLASLFIMLCIVVIWIFWGNTSIEITEIEVASKKIPISFSEFRIAQVSDLHNAEFGKENSRLLKKLYESQADIIVITGDLVDANHTNIEAALDFVKEVIKVIPIYYVTGNHEASIGELYYNSFKLELEKIGVVVLEDDALQITKNEDQITLVGLSDPDFTIKGDLFEEVPSMIEAKINNLTFNRENFSILLAHRPELFETYVKDDIDLILCGHTHGGQIRLPFIGGLVAQNQGFFPSYDAGLYVSDDKSMIVSRGLGNSIIPIRINNRPEIVLITLVTE